MKLLRNFCLAIGALLVLSSTGGFFYAKYKFKAPPNQLVVPDGDFSFPFEWEASNEGMKLEPHAALLLPVTIPGCIKVFYMQFDLGAPYSLFYEGKLESIAEKVADLPIQEGENGQYLKNFSFMLGEMPVKAQEIKLLTHGNSEIDWQNAASIEVIGTIGADLIEKKVMLLNYSHKFMQLSDEVPASVVAKTTFTQMTFDERRVILPAVINHQETEVLFDSGSSAFELLTDKATWQELARKGAAVEVAEANSWGNTLTIHSVVSDQNISFGATELPLRQVHYIEGTSFMQQALMQFSGMAGMVGNKLFLDKVLVLDAQQLRFGIVE
ncbi:hypothetical protein [Pontibacter harenae]|uniref:hypothetical protein n=1 Tax=Pontibacter harenae TaxID=2894083 RepID=UPI001E2A2479|nr:hypothetical protein [Pontibacter harenae]MCC9166004.1 hypothetical protein [Pontibacter harenae]